MKKFVLRAAVAVGVAVTAAAPALAVTVISAGATDPYTGPTPTFDFEASLPAIYPSANVVTGEDGTRARPNGSTGNYFSVGPTEGNPALINLASFGSIESISFLWGSVDDYNLLQILDGGGGVLANIGGAAVLGAGGSFGDRDSPLSNRLVTLNFSAAEANLVSGLRLVSNTNAFEIDNLRVGEVPEPSTWAMLIAGFGIVGFMIRTRRRATLATA